MTFTQLQSEDDESSYLLNYSDYGKFASLFPNQKKFTSSLINPSDFVKIDNGTPLTTCLLITLESYMNLTYEVKQHDSKLNNYCKEIFNEFGRYPSSKEEEFINIPGGNSGSAIYSVQYALRSNFVSTSYKYNSDGYFAKFEYNGESYFKAKNDDNQFRSITAYLQLYIFFISLGSVLDIFAQTVYKLYDLDTKEVNWGNFVDFFRDCKLFNVDLIYQNFLKITNDYDKSIYKPKIVFYRNRFAHDGYCRIEIKKENNNWKLYLPRKSKNGNDIFDFDAMIECENTLIETIKYIDKCYELFYKKVLETNQPPWIFMQS